MGLSVITPPDNDDILSIVTVAQLKKSMRINHSVEDDYFAQCILAAYDWLANPELGWLNRSLLTTTYQLTLPGWVKEQTYSNQETGGPAVRYVPTDAIILPLPPLVSVTGVTYQKSGVQTLDPSQYSFSKSTLFGTLWKATGVTWPTVDAGPEAVSITFKAGYGDSDFIRERCPGIVQGILLLAGDAYRNREDTYAEPRLVAVNRQIINGVARFAGRYRIMNSHA